MFLSLPTFAADLWVTNKTQFAATMATVQPGDVIIWKNGTNTDQGTLTFEPTAQGTAAQPITLRAEAPGGVVFRGTTKLAIGGHHLVVSGFQFDNSDYTFSGTSMVSSVIDFRASSTISRHAYNCRVTDCTIINYDNTNSTDSSKWVLMYGATNRLDHSYFSGKVSRGALLVVELNAAPDEIEAAHSIDRNIFTNRPAGPLNEYETVRVGTSSYSTQNAHVVVASNYFYRCSGEAEIVSNKSAENSYLYNTFIECAGSLTLRHGRGCLVEGNVFQGNNVPDSGGIRVANQDHTIINNYMQDLAGTNYQAGLAIMDGSTWTPPASSPDLLGNYVQVKNVIIAHNTIVNAVQAVNYGVGKGTSGSAVPVTNTLAANIIFSTNAPVFTLTEPAASLTNLNTLFSNLVWGAATGLAANPGLIVTNPLLATDALGFYRPATNSPAIGTAGTEFLLPGTLLDMDGVLRPLNGRDIGADRVGMGLRPLAPLSGGEVGPTWMQPAGLNTNLPPGGNFDLSHWKLTLPIDANGTNIGVAIETNSAALVAGYTNAAYFYTGTDGAMVFWCPVNGATTSGSTYPRSELREMINPTNNNVNWTGYGTHTLDAQCSVNELPSNGKVIIGQIHGFEVNPLVKLVYNGGSIYAMVHIDSGGSTEATLSLPNVALNDLITYRIKVVNGTVFVTVNGITQSTNFFAASSTWTNQTFYFKAGSYCQDNDGPSSEGSRVSFYALAVSHVFNVAPTIDAQPVSQTNTVGASVSFNVSASGTAPLRYQWRFQETNNLSGATNAALMLSNLQLTNAGSYSVVVTNSYGSITSAVANLTVTNSAPGITSQPTPASLILVEGQTAVFTVAASGTPPLGFQWYFNTNTALLNATNTALTLNSVVTNDTGGYTVIITNSFGSVTSAVAALTVNPVPPANTNAYSWDASTGTAGVQDGTGNWSATNANWLLGGTGSDLVWDNNGSSDAIFGGGSSGTAGSVSIPSSYTVNVRNITFNAPNAGSYTVAAKTATSSVLNFAGIPAVTVAAGVSASISTIISGTGFTKEGDGTLTLGGGTGSLNTYNSPVIVNGGTLIVQKSSDGIECITAAGIVVNTGATLLLPKKDQINDAATVTCAGGTIQFVSSGGDTFASLVLNGGVLTNADTGTARTFTMTTAIDVRSGQVAGNPLKSIILAGSTGLTKTTPDTVILGPFVANTYTGPTVISGGVLNITNDTAIGANPATFSPNQLTLDGGTLQIAGSYPWGSKRGVTLTANGGNLDIMPAVAQTIPVPIVGNAGGSLTKANIGTLTFTGTNTYNGNTTISGGTLALSGNGAILGSTNITVAGEATFDVSALTTSLTLENSQTLTASGSASAGTIATASGHSLALGATSELKFTAFNGSTAPLAITGAGTFGLDAGNVVGVTVANGGTPLGTGDFTLISAGGSGGVVGTAPASVTVNGDGIVGGANASLLISGGNLVLHVATTTVAPATNSLSLSGTTATIGITGAATTSYVLETTTNLIGTWVPIQTNTTDGSGVYIFTDLNATNAQQFYRTVH